MQCHMLLMNSYFQLVTICIGYCLTKKEKSGRPRTIRKKKSLIPSLYRGINPVVARSLQNRINISPSVINSATSKEDCRITSGVKLQSSHTLH